MKEANLEEKCRKLTEAHDGKLLKFSTRSEKGWHDRLLLLPGYMALVEFKRSAKAKKQPLQKERQFWCLMRDIPAFQVYTYEQFDNIVHHAMMDVMRQARREA